MADVAFQQYINAYYARLGKKPPYEITWVGSPNYWPGRGNYGPVEAGVQHIMVGTMESTAGWFNNRNSQVSSTFGVAKDGRRIHQYVKLTDTHYANGIPKSINRQVEWLVAAVEDKDWINAVTYSVEHEGWAADGIGEPQYQATLWINLMSMLYLGIGFDNIEDKIIGHRDIMLPDKAGCPGDKFPMTRLRSDLARLGRSNQVPDNTPPAPVDFSAPLGPVQADGLPMWVDLTGPQGKHRIQLGFLRRYLSISNGEDTVLTLQERLLKSIREYGYPLTDEVVGPDGVTRQAIEKIVYEFHPLNTPENRNLGALAGVEFLKNHPDLFS